MRAHHLEESKLVVELVCLTASEERERRPWTSQDAGPVSEWLDGRSVGVGMGQHTELERARAKQRRRGLKVDHGLRVVRLSTSERCKNM